MNETAAIKTTVDNSAPLARLLARLFRTDVLTFPLDPSAHDAVERAAMEGVLNDGDDDGTAVDQARAELVKVTFHVHGIGTDAVDAIIDAHPATKEQRDAARKANDPKPTLDVAGVRAALLAATCERITFSDSDEVIEGLDKNQALAILARFSQDDQGEIQSRLLALDRESTLIRSD